MSDETQTACSDAAGPLAGYSVAITAARRAEELAALLSRRGARVVSAPSIEMVPLSDDTALRAATEAVIATPPDLLIPTTGIGFRGWHEAAAGWGLADELMAALASVRIISRGPKVTGAVRAAGLREEWAPGSKSSAEVLAHLRTEGVAGRRIAVQLHGAIDDWDPNRELVDGLRDLGAEVVEAPVYSWRRPTDSGPLDALIGDLVRGRLDAVTFTSGPAAVSLLTRSRQLGVGDDLLEALRGPVAVYCVGPVTAAPLTAAGVPGRWPERMRLGNLARLVTEDLPASTS